MNRSGLPLGIIKKGDSGGGTSSISKTCRPQKGGAIIGQSEPVGQMGESERERNLGILKRARSSENIMVDSEGAG